MISIMTNTQFHVSGLGRKIVRSDSPVEKEFGFSRATRIGDHVWVAGITAISPEGVVGVGDPDAQAQEVFGRLEAILAAVGATFADVVRTRAFAIDDAGLRAFAKEHSRVFADIQPVSTALLVNGFVHPDVQLEVEVDAYIAPRD
ncbi:putative endoribonuclease L-PSPdomain-containing protein [Mycobacteroides abscessus subsp. abscessus]|nr:putative endoribonuclease L-PSPdomain-containing protein [Mycobacteroides abscessus subsp. abscessus]